MSQALGDFAEDAVVDFKWSTNGADGASITRATNGTVAVYIGNGTTQVTAGVTDTEDFDSLPGIHHCRIDLSADAAYAAGSECQVVLSGATIDGQTVNAVLAHFSIERAGGVLALLKGANGLAAIKGVADAIEADTQDIQSRLPAALVSGRIDASVGAMAANVLTAAATAADFTTEVTSGLATSSAVSTLQTSVDDLPTNAELATALAAADDAMLAALSAVADAIAALPDGVWDEAVDGAVTARQVLRLLASAAGGKVSGGGTSTIVFRDLADTLDRITATVDADGNRSAVTRDLS